MMADAQIVEGAPDTPRSAYTLLPRRTTAAVVFSLVVLATMGWVYTALRARSMSDMVMGLGAVGERMSMPMETVVFLGMWAGMMVAMMAPTVAPTALAYRASLPGRRGTLAPTAAFVFGFLLVWAATGIIALVPYRLILELPATAADSRWLPTLGGALLVAVGALQFSRWKVHCLRECRRPMASVQNAEVPGTTMPALRVGLLHGWQCLGCCWALMVVLLVVGVMNLYWMAVIAAIFLIDKHWAHGEGLTQVVGAALIILGLAVVVFPELLAYLSGVEPSGAATMGGM